MAVELAPRIVDPASLWQRMRRRPALALWALFVALIPLYVAPSGLPQPGDALAVVLFPIALLTRGRLDRSTRAILRPLLWFTLWVAVVNYGWATILWRWDRPKDFLIHPLFYLFNVMLFYSGLVIARRDRDAFLRITTNVVYVAVFVQFLSSFITGGKEYREDGFFNGPNQLGYFALLAACLFTLVQRPLGIPRWLTALGVTCCAYLAVLSASRAALSGIVILLFIQVFANPKLIIAASVVAIAVVLLGGPLATAFTHVEERSQTMARHGTFAEDRGYDRIWEHPEYLLTGAGEGEYVRFARPGEVARELHSSFGSVLFAYGIFGVLLFFGFLFRVFRGASLRDKAILVAGLTFAVAHQGLRFTMFWVVLVVFVVLKQGPPAVAKPV